MSQKPSMSSLQAAALILSEGATDDVETAEMVAEGKILDPDALQRAHFRRMLGFDFTIQPDPDNYKMLIRDDETGITVTCRIEADFNNQAARLAKGCIKLKRLHEAYVAEEADYHP